MFYQTIVDEVRHGSQVMVGHASAFAAWLVQERLDVPLVSLHLQPSVMQSVYDAAVLHPWLRHVNAFPIEVKRPLFRVINREADRVFGPAINDLRAQQGLSPVHGITSRWWHSPKRVIGLFPEWFAAPQPD